jgi:hypothetical protein
MTYKRLLGVLKIPRPCMTYKRLLGVLEMEGPKGTNLARCCFADSRNPFGLLSNVEGQLQQHYFRRTLPLNDAIFPTIDAL